MPTDAPTTLPGDLESCHALIRALTQDLDRQQQRIEYLLRRLFGTRSERLDPNQLALFADAPETPETQEEPAAGEQPASVKGKGHGRKRLSRDLPRKGVVHDIPEQEKVCPQGNPRVVIGEDVSEQLDFTPASYYVIEHVRPVYACIDPACGCGVAQARKPAQPIEKGLAAPCLLAHVITSKYCDHLPLHRQERILARHGIDLSRKTLCDWTIQTAQFLAPVVAAMTVEVLKSKVLHTDDTPAQVQDKEKKRSTRKAYLWPYVGDNAHPYNVFDYTPTRSREGPEVFLEYFRGTREEPRCLQCDAYPGYNGLFTADRHLFEVACWAHARRKFFEAKTSDPVRANLFFHSSNGGGKGMPAGRGPALSLRF
jgi:transposase